MATAWTMPAAAPITGHSPRARSNPMLATATVGMASAARWVVVSISRSGRIVTQTHATVNTRRNRAAAPGPVSARCFHSNGEIDEPKPCPVTCDVMQMTNSTVEATAM